MEYTRTTAFTNTMMVTIIKLILLIANVFNKVYAECENSYEDLASGFQAYYGSFEDSYFIENPCDNPNYFTLSISLGDTPYNDVFVSLSADTDQTSSITAVFGPYSKINSVIYQPLINDPSKDVWLREPVVVNISRDILLVLDYSPNEISTTYRKPGVADITSTFDTTGWNISTDYLGFSTWYGPLNISLANITCHKDCEAAGASSSSSSTSTESSSTDTSTSTLLNPDDSAATDDGDGDDAGDDGDNQGFIIQPPPPELS